MLEGRGIELEGRHQYIPS